MGSFSKLIALQTATKVKFDNFFKESRTMTSREIKCINKSDRFNAHERIVNIGGIENGTRWKFPEQQGISIIETGTGTFHVTRGGRTVEVIVSKSAYGYKYLKTKADGEQPDNLLSLPECP